MRVGISSTETDPAALLDRVLRLAPRWSAPSSPARSPPARPTSCPAVGEKRFTVVALDLGIKAMTPAPDGRARHRGARAARRPRRSTTCSRSSPTGCSSPTARATRPPPPARSSCCRARSARGLPYFGICFGNQLFGRALGFGTYKLDYGHRGINQPVMDRTTGKVEVTAHNHGFAVDAPLDERDADAVRRRDGQPRLPQRRRGRGPRAARRRRAAEGLLGAVPPGGRGRPARCGVPLRPVRRESLHSTERGRAQRDSRGRRLMPKRDGHQVACW